MGVSDVQIVTELLANIASCDKAYHAAWLENDVDRARFAQEAAHQAEMSLGQHYGHVRDALTAKDAEIASLKAQLAASSNSGVDEREAEMIRQDCRLEQQLGKRIGELERELAEARRVLADFLAYYETDFFTLGAKDGRTLAEWIRRATSVSRSTTPTKGADTQST